MIRPSFEHCPNCDQQTVVTADSRFTNIGRKRRKACRSCGHRWSTLEVMFDPSNDIIEIGAQLDQAVLVIHSVLDAINRIRSDIKRM